MKILPNPNLSMIFTTLPIGLDSHSAIQIHGNSKSTNLGPGDWFERAGRDGRFLGRRRGAGGLLVIVVVEDAHVLRLLEKGITDLQFN